MEPSERSPTLSPLGRNHHEQRLLPHAHVIAEQLLEHIPPDTWLIAIVFQAIFPSRQSADFECICIHGNEQVPHKTYLDPASEPFQQALQSIAQYPSLQPVKGIRITISPDHDCHVQLHAHPNPETFSLNFANLYDVLPSAPLPHPEPSTEPRPTLTHHTPTNSDPSYWLDRNDLPPAHNIQLYPDNIDDESILRTKQQTQNRNNALNQPPPSNFPSHDTRAGVHIQHHVLTITPNPEIHFALNYQHGPIASLLHDLHRDMPLPHIHDLRPDLTPSFEDRFTSPKLLLHIESFPLHPFTLHFTKQGLFTKADWDVTFPNNDPEDILHNQFPNIARQLDGLGQFVNHRGHPPICAKILQDTINGASPYGKGGPTVFATSPSSSYMASLIFSSTIDRDERLILGIRFEANFYA